MKIDIVGWESDGLRCPDIKINLMEGDEPAHVALIQMPNGTGKTTTLQMMMATLTGVANRWRPVEVRDMRRPGDSRDRGRFRVDLRADGKPITFELSLDFEEGQVQYRTTTPSTGGMIPKWEPPPGLHRFLTPEFIKLFVFDGEYAERLLNQDANEAERAIDALCQLYLIDEISDVAKQDWEQAVKGRGPTTSVGLSGALNKLAKIDKTISKVRSGREKARKEIQEIGNRIAVLDENIATHISEKTDLREQHERALTEKTLSQSKLDTMLIETIRQMRFPNALHPLFGEALLSLKQNLDRLKLPEATSRQFFIELAEEDLCVCGRALDDKSRGEIINRSKLYLGQEEAGSINALKKDIGTYCDDGQGTQEPALQLESSITDMIEAMRSVHLAEQIVKNLKQSLINSGDEGLAELENERNHLSSSKSQLEDLLKDIEVEATGNEDWETTHCLKALLAFKKETESKITKITGTLKLKKETDIIEEITSKAKNIARAKIREELRNECNDLLLKVLVNDPLQIDSIKGSLSIVNQKGASVGQTLSVGYTFLMSLLRRGDNHFPLVVDSPCGSLGGGRREAIGTLIPELCTQFITFIIDKERDDFIPAIEKSCKGTIKYFTEFRNTPQAKNWLSTLPETGVTQTATGILIEGREYFINFKE